MSDLFLDLLMERLEVVRVQKNYVNAEIPLESLPEPEDIPQAAVDGGGGHARLEGGLSIRIARAVLIGDDVFEKDLDLEIDEWDSLASLEALRSSLELRLANVSDVLTFVDGSAYTQIVTWISRIMKVASGKAKTSEIVALPKTIEALAELLELSKKPVAFVSKEPKFKVFKEIMLAERLSEVTDKDFLRVIKDRPLDKKQILEVIVKYKDSLGSLASPSLLDVHMIRAEGVSKGVVVGLPRQVRSKLTPTTFRKILTMAAEMYKITVGKDIEIPKGLENLCFMKAPVLWWVSFGRWKLTLEEFSGPPLCLAPYREMSDVMPRHLSALIAQSGSNYHSWLSLAHSLSTLRGEHMMTYLSIIKEKIGIGLSNAREELLFLK